MQALYIIDQAWHARMWDLQETVKPMQILDILGNLEIQIC